MLCFSEDNSITYLRDQRFDLCEVERRKVCSASWIKTTFFITQPVSQSLYRMEYAAYLMELRINKLNELEIRPKLVYQDLTRDGW